MATPDTAVFWNRTVKRRTAKWLYAVASHFITGAATSVGTQGSLATVNAIGIQVQPLTLKQMVAVFITGGVFGAMAYLKKSPMPGPTGDTAITQTEAEGHLR